MDEQKAPSLGINVTDGVNMREKFGPGSMLPDDAISFRANAIGLLQVNEDGTVSVVNFSYLNQDKSTKRFMKGLRYNFSYHVEAR